MFSTPDPRQDTLQVEDTGGQETSRRISSFRVSPTELKKRLEVMTVWFQEMTNDQRTLAMCHLAKYIGQTQYHKLSQMLPSGDLHAFCPSHCQDILRQLPSHLTRKIIKYLDPYSLLSASRVCKNWYELFECDWIWKRLSFLTRWRLSPQESHAQLNRHKSEGDGHISWKRVFRDRYKLRKSWLTGQCHVRTFEGHTGGISCVQFDGGRIVSGSHDKTIRVWNIKTNSPWSVMTLTGHSGEVRCLHLEGNRLVSGSTDTTIKVWDLDITPSWSSIGCKVTMVGHTDTVRCLQMVQDQQIVISGSYDETLKIWCLTSGRCLNTLRGHRGRVLCVYVSDNKILLSGSTDKTIKIWSLESGSNLQSLEGHLDAVTCLSLEAKRIISGSLDRTIKLWDLHTGQCLSTLDWMSSEGHTGVIRCLQADSWRILSAADDKTIKVWCLESAQRLVTLRSHTDGVTCLQFNDFYIVSGSYDKSVKLWDFTVC